MIRTTSISVLLLLAVGLGFAQNATEASVDKFIKAQMVRGKIPGVSLAVVKDGKPLIVKGYGVANVEHKVAVKPETIFQSGSVGKQFTSMAVMILVEEGRIGLDEKLIKYIPDVPAIWNGITIRHLLTHTSGLGDYPPTFDLQRDSTELEIFKQLQSTPLASQPGERWAYSNVGYVTLGVLIRKVSGKFYGDFLAERVFRPLGMTTARVISEADIVRDRAAGYELVKGEIKNQKWVAPSLNTTADGALYVSALDMIKWDEALSAGRLLKRESYEQMWSSVKLNNGTTHPYGFGWMFGDVNGKRLIEHSGAWQGFKAHIARYPDNGLTVIVLANLAQTNPSKLAHGVAEIVEPNLIRKPITDPDPKVTAEFRALFERTIAGTVDKNIFSPELQKALFSQPDRLFEFVKGLGPINEFSLVKRAIGGALPTYTYGIEYGEMSLILVIARDSNGKIVLFGLEPT